MPTNRFSIKQLRVKPLSGEQKATESERWKCCSCETVGIWDMKAHGFPPQAPSGPVRYQRLPPCPHAACSSLFWQVVHFTLNRVAAHSRGFLPNKNARLNWPKRPCYPSLALVTSKNLGCVGRRNLRPAAFCPKPGLGATPALAFMSRFSFIVQFMVLATKGLGSEPQFLTGVYHFHHSRLLSLPKAYNVLQRGVWPRDSSIRFRTYIFLFFCGHKAHVFPAKGGITNPFGD